MSHKFEPAEVFNQAMCYLVTLHHLNQTAINPRDPGLMTAVAMPLMSHTALTVELFLKALHCLEYDGVVPRGHDLENLFRNLPMSTRIAVTKRWRTFLQSDQSKLMQKAVRAATGVEWNSSLEVQLAAAKDAFERFRYAFDQEADGLPDFTIAQLPYFLRDVIFDKRPEWRGWKPKPPRGTKEAPAELPGFTRVATFKP